MPLPERDITTSPELHAADHNVMHPWFEAPLEVTSVAVGATAQLDLTFDVGTAPRNGRVTIEVYVRHQPNPALQTHLVVDRATLTNGNAGGQKATEVIHDGSSGDFVAKATSLAVSRPGGNVLRATYTNTNTTGAVDVYFVVLNPIKLTDAVASKPGLGTPSAPVIGAVTRGDQQATVSWSPGVGGATRTGFKVRRYIGGVLNATLTVANPSATSYTDTGRTNGTALTYDVLAYNAAGDSAPSAMSAAVTPAGVPGAATAATIAAGPNKITVTPPALPSNNGDPILGWEVEIFVGGVAESPKQRFASPTAPFDIPNRPTSSHTVKVAAYNSVGVGAQGGLSNAATPTAGGGGTAALLIVENLTLSPSSTVWRDALVAKGYTVTTRLASATEDTGTYAILVIAPEVTVASIGTKYRTKSLPVAVASAALWVSWGAADGTNVGTWPLTDGYIASSHGANGSLSVGHHVWTSAGDQTQHAPGTTAPSGTVLQYEDPAPAYQNARALAFEASAAMLGTAPARPARTFFLGWAANFYAGLTTDGLAVPPNAIGWLVPGPAQAPLAPASMTLTQRDATSLTASWPVPGDGGAPIIDYEVRLYRQNDGVTVHTMTGITTTTYIATGLATDVAVYGQVRARNSVGFGPWSPFSTAVTPRTPTVSARKTIGLHGYYGWAEAAINGGHAREFDLWTLQASEYNLIPQIKANNPDAIVVCYKDFASIRPGHIVGYNADGSAIYPCFANSDAAPIDWYINDQMIQWYGYAGVYFADIENTDYKNHIISYGMAELDRNGWDGVFIDNCAMNVIPGYGEPSGWNQQRWIDAEYALLGQLMPALSADGKWAVMNMGSTSFTGAQIGALLDSCGNSPLAGGGWEYWMNWHHEPGQVFDPYWSSVARDWMATTVGRNRSFLALGMSTAYGNTQLMRYERAAFLVEWDGSTRSWLALHREHNDPFDIWHPEYTIDVGTPTGAREDVGSGVRRYYSGGVALLNPNDFSTSFPLNQTYLWPDGTPTANVTLGAREGAILRK